MQGVGVHQTIVEHMVPGAFVVGLLGTQQLPCAWLGCAELGISGLCRSPACLQFPQIGVL